ncbi:MAG: bifunctional 5,10-methylenetetrahydrofolate dehydrogenase/5,10-methenyltetrahydrofolate cyclohydrolase [Promethearchaeota archaeon]|nr:MAG: bifunctional 5,10-methylenetetrahydrofolate dehydrogenase/5,10-methenyltetrahydrofolate cyclohydrolase [Candidatus Lokiarchaeota archaeon]
MTNDKLLNGKLFADELNAALKEDISLIYKDTGMRPRLAALLVGENPASKIYVNIKKKTCEQIGIDFTLINLDKNISKKQLFNEIDKVNNEEKVNGLILQLPLPKHLQEYSLEFVRHISPIKDVDGLHPYNQGKLFNYDEEFAPATPKGIIALLEHYKVDFQGKEVIIINRSNLVGKPLIFMFLKRNSTVTVCHTSTINIESHIKRADILVVAVGQPNFITKDKIKKKAVIVDVGTNRVDGKLCGDVDFDGVLEKCSRVTPSPGGVGPLTVSFLCHNTFHVFKKQMKFS